MYVLPSTHYDYLDIKAAEVQNMFAPIYKGLSIEKFLEEAQKHQIVMSYLPD